MKDKHIIDILEQAPFADLSKSDLVAIETHANDCEKCRVAYEAAQVAAALLQQHAAKTFAPPPFFETRVLAVLRERKTINDSWGLGHLWRATGALVSSMAATVAILAGLSFVVPGGDTSNDVVSAVNTYSAESVMFGESTSDDQVSDAQVLTTLYDTDEEVAK
jgi:predicted anti-sigma-YlaC factor YlaD